MNKKKNNKKEPEFLEELEEEVEEYIKKLKKKSKKVKAEAMEYLNGWQRERAGFINYKKDVEKRIAEARENARGEVLIHSLQVIDNLELMLKHADEAIKKTNWFLGAEQAYKHAQQTIKNLGLQEIETKENDKFDPAIHEAIEGEGDVIAEVFKKGYKMEHKILRPAQVKVKN